MNFFICLEKANRKLGLQPMTVGDAFEALRKTKLSCESIQFQKDRFLVKRDSKVGIMFDIVENGKVIKSLRYNEIHWL